MTGGKGLSQIVRKLLTINTSKQFIKGGYKNLIKKNQVSKFICYGAIAVLKYIYFLWCQNLYS